MNPILVGITSFLGMALFFIFSMFIYPRLMYHLNFPFVSHYKRSFSDIAEIASVVADSIEYYNKMVNKNFFLIF